MASAPCLERTVEPQYEHCLSVVRRKGHQRLGIMSSQTWNDDPRRLVIMLARYKFVAKILSGRRRVLEVGCGDAFGTRIVLQEVGAVSAIDIDPLFIEDVRERMDPDWKFDAHVHDILQGPVQEVFDGAYSLDLLEHIPIELEDRYVRNIAASLSQHGVLLVGSPSLQSQPYASPLSRAGHVNCKTADDLRAMMQRYFHTVFIFSMNDELVHTGFYPMAHYLFACCCSPRDGLC